MKEDFITKHRFIAEEYFVIDGGIRSVGVKRINDEGDWATVVDIFEDYPGRNDLIRNILALDPEATINFVPGMRLIVNQ
jgi:hypothetical protein